MTSNIIGYGRTSNDLLLFVYLNPFILKVSRRYTLTTLSPLCQFSTFCFQRGTEHITMATILEEESSVSENYNVIDNIFRQQMGLEEQLNEDGNQRLIPIAGDQKTGWYEVVNAAKLWGILCLPPVKVFYTGLNYLQMVLNNMISNFYGGRTTEILWSTINTLFANQTDTISLKERRRFITWRNSFFIA